MSSKEKVRKPVGARHPQSLGVSDKLQHAVPASECRGKADSQSLGEVCAIADYYHFNIPSLCDRSLSRFQYTRFGIPGLASTVYKLTNMQTRERARRGQYYSLTREIVDAVPLR
ncbi:MAG: hypothetical protein QNJ51_03930 [Calothrix sp. MO_167.B12]|nr:hypothetical protein [Calothrix sp. MO_167.B12]